MKDNEFKTILGFLVNKKHIISKMLECQDEELIKNGVLRFTTNFLLEQISNFMLQNNLIPNQITNYSLAFSGDILVLNISVMPTKLIGLVNITYYIEIKSLDMMNGTISGIFAIREELGKTNSPLKKMAISSFARNQTLISHALKHATLPSTISLRISDNFLEFSVKHEQLKKLDSLSLKFKETKNDFLYFKYKWSDNSQAFSKTSTTSTTSNSSLVAPSNVQLDSDFSTSNKKVGISLRDMLNYSDRF